MVKPQTAKDVCLILVLLCLLATSIPKCYRAVMVHGFVEELVVNEDPEYQWIDRIRTPRASNEARQRLISLMSGEEKYVHSFSCSPYS